MLRKAFSLLSWFSCGCSGRPNPDQRHPRNKVFRFAICFCCVYAAALIAWRFVYPYYQALLIYTVIELARIVTSLPPLLPELMADNTINIKINSITIFPSLPWFTNTTPILAALMLSSSGIRLVKRMKMLSMGIGLLLLSQVLSVFVQMYRWLFIYYAPNMRKGVIMPEILEYDPVIADILVSLAHVEMISQFVFVLGIWMILVYLLKRRGDSPFPVFLL